MKKDGKRRRFLHIQIRICKHQQQTRRLWYFSKLKSVYCCFSFLPTVLLNLITSFQWLLLALLRHPVKSQVSKGAAETALDNLKLKKDYILHSELSETVQSRSSCLRLAKHLYPSRSQETVQKREGKLGHARA